MTFIFSVQDNEGSTVNKIYFLNVFTEITETYGFHLNDTGLAWGATYDSSIVERYDRYINNSSCEGNVIAQQDCSHGRDADNNSDIDGLDGFSFTKLDENGNQLPAGASQWSCVLDNVTGLIWEKKTESGVRSKENKYRWGGKTAALRSVNTYYDDWDELVDAANNNLLCGYSDWRVPSYHELLSLVNFGQSDGTIDIRYFPSTGTAQSTYHTSSPLASGGIWVIDFVPGAGLMGDSPSKEYPVRLVYSQTQ
jgi:hypothetical protein